jgi:hypothetical protein
MGRKSTGATTCEECKRIELSYLLKKGYLRKGQTTIGNLIWTNKDGFNVGEIQVKGHWGKDEKYIRLGYTFTDREGKAHDYDYKIYLEAVPSNLGKGEVLYFLCPQSGKRCRVLYMAYGCPIWKAREAYTHRIYYNGQTSSKYDRPNDRYWVLERRLEKLHREKYLTYSYNGRPTKKALRLERMREKRDYFDSIRWLPQYLPVSLRGAVGQFFS